MLCVDGECPRRRRSGSEAATATTGTRALRMLEVEDREVGENERGGTVSMGNALNRPDPKRLPDRIERFSASVSFDSKAQMKWRIASESQRSEKDEDSTAEELVLTESKNFDKVGSI